MLDKDWRMCYHDFYKKDACNYLSAYLADEWEFRSRWKVQISAETYDFVYKKIWDYVDKYADMYFDQFDNPMQLYNRCFSKIIRIIWLIFDFWDDCDWWDIDAKAIEWEKNQKMRDLVQEEMIVFYNYK